MSLSRFSLAGKRALLTGASSGIGREIAKELGSAGASVLLVGRESSRLRQAADEVATTGAKSSSVVADIVTVEGRARIANAATIEMGGIDVLVHSAGVYQRSAFSETSLELLDHHLDVNFRAPYALTQTCLPLLSKGSSVIFLSSIAASTGIRNSSAYAGSKGAIESLTAVLALELAARGIRVNAVAPGFAATPMNATLRADPAIAEFTTSVTPMARLGEPQDIAPAVVFLASDAARFVCGIVLPITGGYPNAFTPTSDQLECKTERGID